MKYFTGSGCNFDYAKVQSSTKHQQGNQSVLSPYLICLLFLEMHYEASTGKP